MAAKKKPQRKQVVGAKRGKIGTAARQVKANTSDKLTPAERKKVMTALSRFQSIQVKDGKPPSQRDLNRVLKEMEATMKRRKK